MRNAPHDATATLFDTSDPDFPVAFGDLDLHLGYGEMPTSVGTESTKPPVIAVAVSILAIGALFKLMRASSKAHAPKLSATATTTTAAW